MKFLKVKKIQFLILFVLILKYICFISYPYLGVDGPWSLSSAYSFIIGLENRSVFAHDFLGDIFKVHTIDYFYYLWFNIFNFSTNSFISLGFVIISLTLLSWCYIASKLKGLELIINLLMLGYVISPYTYGFRPENLSILIISLIFITNIIFKDEILKIIITSFFFVISGLIHHIGGMIALILITYYFLIEIKNYIGYLKFIFCGIFFGFLLTQGNLIDYLLLPFQFKSEMGNHFNQLNFTHFFKYLIYAGPIPVIILILLRKQLVKKDYFFMLFFFFLFSFLGRSYYIPYIYLLVLFMILIRRRHGWNLNFYIDFKNNKYLIFPPFVYSFLFLFAIPFILVFFAPQTNATWKKVLTNIKLERKNWKKNCNYYVPSQLTLEVADDKKARLLYHFIRHNEGIQDVDNKIFYVNSLEQIDWIKKNFNIKNKNMIIEELVPQVPGAIKISSIYKFKLIHANSFGLFRIHFDN